MTHTPEFEAFVAQRSGGSWSVIAIMRGPVHTEARPFAAVLEPNKAVRLADALNSRLLGRRNHDARLQAALAELALSVHAAARRVPVGAPDSLRVPLADHLSGEPVDGYALFATDSPLTPRTARAIAFAAEQVADTYHDLTTIVLAHSSPRADVPSLAGRRRAEDLLRIASDLDLLTADLRDGLMPDLVSSGSRMALRLALQHACRLPRVALADHTRFLPAGRRDHDYDTLALSLHHENEERCDVVEFAPTRRARAAGS